MLDGFSIIIAHYVTLVLKLLRNKCTVTIS